MPCTMYNHAWCYILILYYTSTGIFIVCFIASFPKNVRFAAYLLIVLSIFSMDPVCLKFKHFCRSLLIHSLFNICSSFPTPLSLTFRKLLFSGSYEWCGQSLRYIWSGKLWMFDICMSIEFIYSSSFSLEPSALLKANQRKLQMVSCHSVSDFIYRTFNLKLCIMCHTLNSWILGWPPRSLFRPSIIGLIDVEWSVVKIVGLIPTLMRSMRHFWKKSAKI